MSHNSPHNPLIGRIVTNLQQPSRAANLRN